MTKPVIGITPSRSHDTVSSGTFDRYALATTYLDAVQAAGGIPIILPPQPAHHVDAILERIDGLLLSGGADIDPARYGDGTLHPETYGIDPLRDECEIALVHAALASDMPVLCICRGIQVLNVALGGTLYQHVPEQFPSSISHRQQEIGIPSSEPCHAVHAEPGSLLETMYGSRDIQTNSFHHQAINRLADPLCIEGRTADGLIEAVSLPGHAFVFGVQWHPEMMFQCHPEHLRPFAQLVAAATQRVLAPVQH